MRNSRLTRQKLTTSGSWRLLYTLLPIAVMLWSAGALVAQQRTIPLWPEGPPEPTHFDRPEYDPTTSADRIKAGKVTVRVTDVSQPEMLVSLPEASRAVHVGVVVFPGGGYEHLAWNIEGTEVCDWLNSIGVGCAAVKYRVPEKGRFPDNPADFEDAQQAIRIFRSHAKEWNVEPDRIGVAGFSAGGNLAALLSRNYAFQGKAVPASTVSARPSFQMLFYPGSLTERGDEHRVLDSVQPNQEVGPTFIVQAMNDPAVHVEGTLSYAEALKAAGVSTELHIFAEGGHGFGLRPTNLPVSQWPVLAQQWLRTIHMLPKISSAAGTHGLLKNFIAPEVLS